MREGNGKLNTGIQWITSDLPERASCYHCRELSWPNLTMWTLLKHKQNSCKAVRDLSENEEKSDVHTALKPDKSY